MSATETVEPPQVARTSKLRGALLLTIIVGIFASVHLIQVHLEVAMLGSAQSGLCNFNEVVNCTGSATSKFSSIAGIPIAALGFAFYLAALLVTLLGARIAGERSGQSDAPVGDGSGLLVTLFGLGSAYSVFLLIVSGAIVGSICPWCALTYLVNFVGLGITWRWYGASPFVAIKRQLLALGTTFGSRPVWVFLPIFIAVTAGVTVWEHNVILSRPQAEPPQAAGVVDQELLHIDTAPALGPADAPVHIVEFSDFQCPYCSRLATTMRELEAHYGDQVRIEFRQFPLEFHEHADRAALGGVCAHEQGKFWEYHDEVFEHQRRIGGDGLLALARDAGLDANSLEDCMESAFARGRVDEDIAAGEAVGVNGTPYFFINGVMYAGAYPYADIAELIDAHLAE